MVSQIEHLEIFNIDIPIVQSVDTEIIEEEYWARIFKRLRSPEIESKESIPPTYVIAWRAGTITLFLLGS